MLCFAVPSLLACPLATKFLTSDADNMEVGFILYVVPQALLPALLDRQPPSTPAPVQAPVSNHSTYQSFSLSSTTQHPSVMLHSSSARLRRQPRILMWPSTNAFTQTYFQNAKHFVSPRGGQYRLMMQAVYQAASSRLPGWPVATQPPAVASAGVSILPPTAPSTTSPTPSLTPPLSGQASLAAPQFRSVRPDPSAPVMAGGVSSLPCGQACPQAPPCPAPSLPGAWRPTISNAAIPTAPGLQPSSAAAARAGSWGANSRETLHPRRVLRH